LKYVPFLKLKTNELRALRDLDNEIQNSIRPFFDVVYFDEMTTESLKEKLQSIKKDFKKTFTDELFYIDNFDHNIASIQDYGLILEEFKNFNVIPVVGLDRSIEHIEATKEYLNNLNNDMIKRVAIRLSFDDIQSFTILEYDLEDYLNSILKIVDEIDIVVDLRVITENRIDLIAKKMIKFLHDIKKSNFKYSNLIVTGSSLDSLTGKNIKTEEQKDIDRNECILWHKISQKLNTNEVNLIFGDYTTIPPNYSDNDLSIQIISNVMTPKIYYTYEKKYFAIRGASFKSHSRGWKQYCDLAKEITNDGCYRGKSYSAGDAYIYERANSTPKTKCGNASSWIRATVNLHITFVTNQL